jgi:hypothetical protein
MTALRRWFTIDGEPHHIRSVAMLFLHVELMNARNADLRRAADRERGERTAYAAHPARAPQPPLRARRSLRTTAAAVVTRAAR